MAALPHGVDRPPLIETAPTAVQYVDEPDANFVAPELNALPGGTPIQDASLVLISAPAAVGKSMLARAVAHASGGALWNLGSFHVGSNFLVGTVGSSHGYSATGTVMSELSAGRFLIVMDALDEATVKAGLANLEAFAIDVATVLNGLEPSGPVAVLLARAETAELAQLILEEYNLPIAHYAISYFDRARAEEFIDRKLDQRAFRGHRENREPFEHARSLLFDRVFSVIGVEGGSWDEPEARGFLGYAPVLEALTEYLHHPNYAILVNEIEASIAGAGAAPDSIWRFLIRIIEDVLEREREKLTNALADDLTQRIDAAGRGGAIYTPAEQCARLVARVLRQEPPDPDLSVDIRKDYEEAVAQFLSEHPFVGSAQDGFVNVVFRDYVFARALLEGAPGQQDGVRAFAADASYRPSPLLARFLFELMPPDARQLDIADFPIAYDSLRAEDSADQASSLEVTEDGGNLVAQFVSATGEPADFLFAVGEGESLQVWRRLTNAVIDLEHVPVVLGRAGEAFTIGPNATIWSPEVRLRASEFRVESREQPETAPTLVTDRFVGETPESKIIQNGPHPLQLFVPHSLAYPWVQFKTERVAEDEPEPDVAPALNDLAKLVTRFKSEGFGGLGMYAKPLDAAAAKGRTSQPLLDYALERGLITREGKLYHLHPELFGLNLPQVKAKVASGPVHEFLRGFLEATDTS